MIFSHSKLNCFEQCPLRFRYKYIDRIKTKLETIEAFLGKLVHEALEKIYWDLEFRKMNKLEDLLDFFNSRWDRNWNNNIIMVRKNNPETHRNLGIKFLTDYYNNYKPFNHSQTLGLEMPFRIDLNGFKIKGFIDRLSLTGDILEIHDYKTSLYLPFQEQLEQDRQLALYAIAAREMIPFAKQINLVWHFLAFSKEIGLTAKEERLEQTKLETIRLIEKINSEKNFQAKESKLCSWCEFQQICRNKGK